jgi:hypothetical protein
MEIVNVSYPEGEIGAKGVDDKLYFWGCIDQTCHQWNEVPTLPDNDQKQPGLPIKKLKSCPESNPSDGNFPTEEPPGIIAECVFQYTRSGLGFTGTYIALLEDCKVWRWHPQNTATDFPILSLMIGPSLGFLIGLFMGVFFVRQYLLSKDKKIARVQKTSEVEMTSEVFCLITVSDTPSRNPRAFAAERRSYHQDNRANGHPLPDS